MRLISNTGTNRVIDALRQSFRSGASLDIASPFLSLFAFFELRDLLSHSGSSRLILPLDTDSDLKLLGSAADRPARNRLHARWLARECAKWIRENIELRLSSSPLPQSAYIIRQIDAAQSRVITGNCPLTTDGLGLTPGNQFSLIQCAETPEEVELFAGWYESLWNGMPASDQAKEKMLVQLQEISDHNAAALIYYQILFQLFKTRGDELDEDRIVKSATGIKNTTVWKKLFKFQRDGVVGAIEKLERFGGCIIADSVGLGKTFEALAIIKYYELRNDRVLVLVPKRLRDNWTLYKANDRRNVLSADRFNYDVLNHTDLSRDSGSSGDIDLANVNWGNYDLVVIDESHNFRNKTTRRDRETRYDRLMRRIIREGVKTRVLMLSATPVNNRLADLRNQIAFVTEGQDTALFDHGITSIDATTRMAQKQFNRWLAMDDAGQISWATRQSAERSADSKFRPTCLMERVSIYLEGRGPEGACRREVEENVQGKAQGLRQAMDALIAEHFAIETVTGTGPKAPRVIASIHPYRQAMDAQNATIVQGRPGPSSDCSFPPSSFRPPPSRGDGRDEGGEGRENRDRSSRDEGFDWLPD